ncbi:ParB/RepB/Spo0J family partition protein [Nostoc sp. FACHB-145]|uniref:ParB/RepB/Spo0J family partition protein n=1 Tax=Nostoc sp. FACHB-145 TaxID=2692836 RepID=UPI00168267D5|nr:ParB/RepB/Spo0J family partition protein [Nostoc sp. FACHB-145]MBD2472373.1 ParB/RepB/Spo0J family partition protein [Nostoc sp. FACHB-145]
MATRRTTTQKPPADRSKLKNVALFQEDEQTTPLTVPVEKIVLPPSQPRRYFDPQAMQALVESVKRDGILQPLLVRRVQDNYEVVAGERRYRAAKEVGLTEVPITIREMSDEQAVQYALVENLQREDLNPVEATEGILQLLSLQLGCDTASVTALLYRMENEAKGKITRNVSGNSEAETVEKTFANLARMNWQSFVRTRLPLLKLPDDILEALRAGRIEYTKAKEIAKLESQEDRSELLETAIELSMSLSQIKEEVKKKQPKAQTTTLQSRLETAYKQAKKAKVWENPQKQEKLKSLLAELEALVASSD